MKINPRRTKSTCIVVMLVVSVFIVASIVPSMAGASPWSDPNGNRRGMPRKGYPRQALNLWQNQQLIEQIELTEEQVQRLRDADFSSREKQLELRTRKDQLQLQMVKLFSHKKRHSKAVRQLAQKIADIKGQIFVHQVEDRLMLETILTSDQIMKLKRDRMQRKRGRFTSHKRHDAKDQLAGSFGDGD